MTTLGTKWSVQRRIAHAAKFGSAIDRFMERIQFDTNGGCWLWSGTILNAGYGQIQIDGVPVAAHRLSWMLFHGDIPEGLWVLHKCDVRACVNPAHHFLGTASDNMADMVAKGRSGSLKGDASPTSKLRSTDIPVIIGRLRNGERCKAIGDDYGVDQCAINAIRRGRSWGHVTGIVRANG